MRLHGSQIGVRPFIPVMVRLRVPSGMAALGIPPGPTPESVIAGELQNWQTVHPSIPCPAPSPDQIAQNLRMEAQGTCTTWPAQCPNGIPEAAIANAVAYYADMIHWDGSKAALCPVPGESSQQQQQQQQQTQQQGSVTPTVSLVNTSHPGSSFQVGDSFTLVVSGSPNQPVTGSGSQNGQSKGTTPYGNTNGSGQFQISGTFGADTIGNWSEIWTVGGKPSAPIAFTVAAPPAAQTSGGGSSSSGSTNAGSSNTSTSSTSSSSTTATGSGSSSTSFDFGSIMTKLQAPSPVFGLPWGIVVGGALFALWFFSTRGKGAR